MIDLWAKTANLINSYRLHVVIIFLVLAYLFSFQLVPSFYQTEYYAALVVFGFLWAAFYIGNKCFDFEEDSISQPQEARAGKQLQILTAGLYLVPVVIIFFYNLPLLPYLALSILTLGYSIHLPGTKLRVKKVLFLKNFYAATTWWISIAFFVLFYLNIYITAASALLHTFSVFFFLLIIEPLWDIRDIEGDKVAGNITIPVFFGITLTKLYIVGLIFLLWWSYSFDFNPFLLINIVYLFLVTLFVQTGFRPSFFHSIVYTEIVILLGQIIFIDNYF